MAALYHQSVDRLEKLFYDALVEAFLRHFEEHNPFEDVDVEGALSDALVSFLEKDEDTEQIREAIKRLVSKLFEDEP